ncbi:MAG: Protein translocase subunit SecD [Thermoanaerobacterales bacterium 50_218]|nr:MAG: Protein translocase subunit SecD [Thermoanaerobacterales bacterium 50_218]HAA89439.1 protein translocase subunit SecD [Peptococcaceae bacterium]
MSASKKGQEKKTGVNWVEAGKLFLIVLIIVGLAIGLAQPLAEKLQEHLGLDLKGGVHVVYEAIPSPGSPVTSDAIARLIAVIRNRVDALGVTEPVIQKEGTKRVVVELPGVKDPEEAVRLIGKTAHLEFKTEDGKTVLTGKDLKDARAQLNPQTSEPEVLLKFDKEGAKKFGEVTTANVGRRIVIYLDDKLLTAPVVEEPITTGEAVIRGGYRSLEEAQQEAILLRSGALPVKVELLEKRTVGPVLGKDSLDRSLKAGIIGILLIFVFMIAYYRVPGLIADLSLVVYGLLVAGIFLLIKATLTLPGIAGFILSIGMAVDANIIIYERIKEELRAGKTLRAAIDAGFQHAFRAILDANVTTLIAAAVLYYFGSGPIRGFAVTLSIGILTSMFTAITFTRYLLHLLARSRLVLNPKAYGA